MLIAMGQMSSDLGDFRSNSKKMVAMAEQARDKGCQLIVFPELSLLGYHPFDLLERPEVLLSQEKVLDELLQKLPQDIHCLIGVLIKGDKLGKAYFDSAILTHQGQILKTFHKELLPAYDVFDDTRHFESGSMVENTVVIQSSKIQILICEDMWGWDDVYKFNPILNIKPGSQDLVINMSASPFHVGKLTRRKELAHKTCQYLRAPLLYVNMIGGQDELIFDGQSFFMNREGQVVSQAPAFTEFLTVLDTENAKEKRKTKPNEKTKSKLKPKRKLKLDLQNLSRDIQEIRQALVLGLKDFFRKNKMAKAHLGLSGGIDSAVALCLLAEALGPENVSAIGMPTRFNESKSLALAQEMTKLVGCPFHTLEIDALYASTVQCYESAFGKKKFSVMHENMQSRLRGLLLMAFANDNKSLLVSTSNKSEMAMGYSTLYGDMCGAISPLGDLLKSEVYALAEIYNQEYGWIPQEIITRPPSAELRENQKDSDSLPDYAELDRAVDNLISQQSLAQTDVEKHVLKQVYQTEFKRWQAPPILKVSEHAFGRGRRLPISLQASALLSSDSTT